MMGFAANNAITASGSLEDKLSSFVRLSQEDLEPLHGEASDARMHAARDVVPGEAGAIRLVTGGWIGVARELSDGRRQILQVAIAGDLVAPPPLGAGQVVALTNAHSLDARPLLERLLRGCADRPGLRRAWFLAQEEEQRNLLAHIMRLGALTAYERTANLLVELVRRHQRAGLWDGRRIPWPVTQEVLSDFLGLSIVHVNRILQQLRRDGLIEHRSGWLAVRDMPQLAAAGLADQPVFPSRG